MKRPCLFVLILGFTCLVAGTAFGDIIHVPTAEYPTIQAGIDAASLGDTVQVVAGTYYENITMKSGVVIQGAGQGISTIDGGGNGSVVTAISVNSTATLDGFTITGGVSVYGGGMYNEGSSPTVSNCTFSGNSATQYGGGMYNNGSSPTVTNCIFSGNSANTTNGQGGGIYNNGSSSPTVTNCTFSGNSAAGGGGMLNYRTSPTVTNCIFSGNTATGLGGGMYNNGSSPTVTNCTFSGNSAGHGGGMRNYGSSPTVTNCTFSGNDATWGGGIGNYGSSPTVTNCTFSGNSADFYGGGMYNTIYNFVSSSPTVTNCTFSGNSADGGGGMYSNGSSPTVTNCTFFGNSAGDGGGMLNHDSSPTVTNCILWGDTPSGSEIHSSESSSPVVTYSDIQGGHAGTGNINADPMFVDSDGLDNVIGTEDDDLHLKSSSPCIDAGTAIGAPSTDFEGDPRPQGAGYDIGADEYVDLVANFSANPTSGPAPLTVNFSDQSTGTVSSWNWDFGDGSTSTVQNPSHTYTSSGRYTVSLTVTGPAGSDTETKTDYINVTEVVTEINAMPWIPLLLLDD